MSAANAVESNRFVLCYTDYEIRQWSDDRLREQIYALEAEIQRWKRLDADPSHYVEFQFPLLQEAERRKGFEYLSSQNIESNHE